MDLTIYETGNGGDLQLLNNDVAQTDSIFNQVYIALFAGVDWWGDSIFETDFNTLTEQTLNTTALTPQGVAEIEEAIKTDLKFLNDIAEITIESNLFDVDKLKVDIKIQQTKLSFIWDSTKKEIIIDIIL